MDVDVDTNIDLRCDDNLVDNAQSNRLAYICSRALSLILHPLTIPTYATIITVFNTSAAISLTLKLKLYIIGSIALSTLLMPIVAILLMSATGVFKDLKLSGQKKKLALMFTVAIYYIICITFMSDSLISMLVNHFIFPAIGSIVVAFIINLRWRVSLHLIAMGNLTAILIYSYLHNYGLSAWLLIFTLILSGAIASARLYLGSNNTEQVTIGYSAGVIASLIIMYLI